MAGAGEEELLADVRRLFHKKRADGARAFTREEKRAALFVLFLRIEPEGRAELIQLPDVAELVGEWAVRIGVRPGEAPETITAKLERHFEAHPLHVDLASELERILAARAAGHYGRPSAGAMKRLLGDEPRAPAPKPGARRRRPPL